MTVRVLRLLEYTFSDQETADQHMASWGMPANGVKRLDQHRGHYQVDREIGDGYLIIRSATLPQETLPEEPPQIPPEQAAWFKSTGAPPPPHSFMKGFRTAHTEGVCQYPGCGLAEEAKIHEADPGWPPQDS